MGARKKDRDLWSGGVVAYEINPDLGNIVSIYTAIKTMEQQTNVRFVRRYLHDDYVRFSKQTAGNPHTWTGRKGGEQFLNASNDDVGSLLHELGHSLGLMHEHQRPDRDTFVIFHAERVTGDLDDWEREDAESKSAEYDYQSLMHYPNDNPPIFESRTGTPLPTAIGPHGVLTPTDRAFIATLYPAPPVIRRSDGEDGAGKVSHTSSIAIAHGASAAYLVNAVVNGDGDYQLIRWRVGGNGGIIRSTNEPDNATGGSARDPQVLVVGDLFVSVMRDVDGNLLLISHDVALNRLADSAGQAGEVRAFHAVTLLPQMRVLTACVLESGRLLSILWEIAPDGEITRLFDSDSVRDHRAGSSDPPGANTVAVALYAPDPEQRTVAILCANSSRLVLSMWRISDNAIMMLSDSGDAMGQATLANVVSVPSGPLVVVCKDHSGDLLLIPFRLENGRLIRTTSGQGRAGAVREIAAIARPYGLLTAVIDSDGRVLLIKWAINVDGHIERLGDSGTQAGEASAISVTALPFPDLATVCTSVRAANGQLLPISWDDADGPGELHVARVPQVVYEPVVLDQGERVVYREGAFTTAADAQKAIGTWQAEGRKGTMMVNAIPLFESANQWDIDR